MNHSAANRSSALFVALLSAGIVLRIVTFFYLSPSNSDHHEEVIVYLIRYHALPQIPDVHEAHNPPLYYVIAASLWFTHRLKAVQGLSLVFSMATLVVLFRLITRSGLIRARRAQVYSCLLACFLPQFVLFSLYVTSDTLAILLGSLAAIATWRYIRAPSWRELVVLSVVEGAGLLTKTIFVVLIPVLGMLICWYPREKHPGWNALLRAEAFIVIVTLLGGFKFADNLMRYGDPFYSNMDLRQDWSIAHERTYRGPVSFFDINPSRLVTSPIAGEATTGSYPVLLYGTFWYPHIPDEGSFNHGQRTNLRYVGSVTYVMALLPGLLFFAGLGKLLWGMPALLRTFDASREEDLRKLARTVCALTIAIGILLLDVTAMRHHEWSIFQGRFLFPWFFGGAVAFSAGVEMVSKYQRAVDLGMGVLIALFIAFFASEIAWAATT